MAVNILCKIVHRNLVYLNFSHSIGMQRCLILVFSSIFLLPVLLSILSCAHLPFIYLYLLKCPFKYFAMFTEVLFFLLLSYMKFICIYVSIFIVVLCKYFLPFHVQTFLFLTIFFKERKFLTLMNTIYQILLQFVLLCLI